MQRAFESDPFNRKVLTNYIDVLHTLNRNEEIDTIASKLIQLSSNKVETYTTLGNLYKRLGDMTKAGAYFEKALQYSPDDVALLHQLGSIHLFQTNFLEAASVF